MTKSGNDPRTRGRAAALVVRTGAARPILKKRRMAEALLVSVLACLVSVGWLAWRNMHAQIVSDQWETHSRIVMQQWADLLSSLKDAETGQRGFIITGNPDYLEPYYASRDDSFTQLADLRRLTADNPAQQQRLAAITPLVAAKLASLKQNIALRETRGFTAASQSVMTQSGKHIMDQIRVLVTQAWVEEQLVLNERIATSKTDVRKTVQSLMFAGTLGSLALLLLFVLLRWELVGRRRAETAEDASELQYQTLFNLIGEGFCIIEMIFDDHKKPVDYRFLEVNPSFEKQSGMHDVIGKRVREIIPDLEDHWFQIYGEVALTGVPARLISEVKALDRWLDIRAVRLGGVENRQVVVTFDNVTERMRADEILRHSEQRFRALFDRGPVAMYLCDTSGMILQYNLCAVKLWGREPTPDDVDERYCGVSKVYRPDGALLTASQNPMIAVLKGEISQVNEVEAVLERPDGSRITVIANIVPLKDCHGEITGAINCFYDITERSRLERETQDQAQALAELHRRKDEFLAMLSHELRNPLAPLTSAVELLRLQKNQNPAYSQACQVIERQVGQMKHLVDDLLEVSRITSGNVRLRKKPVRMGDLVERALETVQPLILKRRHQLTVSLPPGPLWLEADATRLEQVLVNLLNNAAKYTDEGGCLWLSVGLEDDAASKAGEAVVVTKVRDTGIGITPELLPHVFELFTQAERAIDRSQGGMGVGLCLVRQLVELHGGSVEAHSILGQGSEFVVRLPAMPAAVPPVSLPPPFSDPVRPTARSCRVLAVDDSVDAVEFMAKLLRLSGHEVEIAYDGPGALKAAVTMRPDVVLLDIGLPGLTGYEVARQMRQEPALKNTVLVALTGYGRESDRQRSKNAGFDHHLVKPAGVREVEEILATVGEQLALQRRPAQPVVPKG